MKKNVFFTPSMFELDYFQGKDVPSKDGELEFILQHPIFSEWSEGDELFFWQAVDNLLAWNASFSIDLNRPWFEDEFKDLEGFLVKILEKVSKNHSKLLRLRVSDYGLLEWLSTIEATKLDISQVRVHLVLETAHRNSYSLKALSSYFESTLVKLEKVVFSWELSEEDLEANLSELRNTCFANVDKLETEILGAGPILLYRSPRKLLAGTTRSDSLISGTADSLESPHKNYRLKQGRNGTMMYHPRLHSIGDKEKLVEKFGITCLRFDTRFIDFELVMAGTSELSESLKKERALNVLYSRNKQDVLFGELSNTKIKGKQGQGFRVLGVEKGKHLLIENNGNGRFSVGDKFLLSSTSGEEKEVTLNELLDPLSYQTRDYLDPGELGLISYVKKMGVKSQGRKFTASTV